MLPSILNDCELLKQCIVACRTVPMSLVDTCAFYGSFTSRMKSSYGLYYPQRESGTHTVGPHYRGLCLDHLRRGERSKWRSITGPHREMYTRRGASILAQFLTPIPAGRFLVRYGHGNMGNRIMGRDRERVPYVPPYETWPLIPGPVSGALRGARDLAKPGQGYPHPARLRPGIIACADLRLSLPDVIHGIEWVEEHGILDATTLPPFESLIPLPPAPFASLRS